MHAQHCPGGVFLKLSIDLALAVLKQMCWVVTTIIVTYLLRIIYIINKKCFSGTV